MLDNVWKPSPKESIANEFPLYRSLPSGTPGVYALSHTMQCSENDLQPYLAHDIVASTSVERTEGGENYHSWEQEMIPRLTEPRQQICTLAHSFPPDILLLIFSFALWDRNGRRMPLHNAVGASQEYPSIFLSKSGSPIFLASICAYWRLVCLSTPSIWSNLQITRDDVIQYPREPRRKFRLERSKIKLCDLFLRRSDPVPLSVDIVMGNTTRLNDNSDLYVAQAIKLCLQHHHRLKSLKIGHLGPDQWNFAHVFNFMNANRETAEPILSKSPDIGIGFPALETLVLAIKEVRLREEETRMDREYCGLITLPYMVAFINQLPSRCPRLRQIKFSVLRMQTKLAYPLLSAFSALFPKKPSFCTQEEEETEGRKSTPIVSPKPSSTVVQLYEKAHERFEAWCTEMWDLRSTGARNPILTGTSSFFLLSIVKEVDGIGFDHAYLHLFPWTGEYGV